MLTTESASTTSSTPTPKKHLTVCAVIGFTRGLSALRVDGGKTICTIYRQEGRTHLLSEGFTWLDPLLLFEKNETSSIFLILRACDGGTSTVKFHSYLLYVL